MNNYCKYKFKYSLIKDPNETSSLKYIKQQLCCFITINIYIFYNENIYISDDTCLACKNSKCTTALLIEDEGQKVRTNIVTCEYVPPYLYESWRKWIGFALMSLWFIFELI